MNKLPKEIYVNEDSKEPVFFADPKICAEDGKTVTLAVYKLVGKVEVSTEMRQEIVVKKSPTAKKKDKPIAVEMPQDRDALLDVMRTTD